MFHMLKAAGSCLTKILRKPARIPIRYQTRFRPSLEALEDRLAPATCNWVGPQTATENVPLLLSAANSNAISVSDADPSSTLLQFSLTATQGTLTLHSASRLTFSSGSGSGDASMTFVGTIDDINAAFDGL